MGNRHERRAAQKATRQPRRSAQVSRLPAPRDERRRPRADPTPALSPGPRRPPAPVQTDWMPVPAVLGLLAVGLLSYFGAEVSLQTRPHPAHWAVAGIGALVGYGAGFAVYKRRGY